ncbi:hypothetical protein CYMTET_10338 [Cymbomonas tetramitiformis]|uniref:HECT-type E3 ubiquitin transferase n=1 Tax=Cymbomonas tetramitiformis TaxID=36881 RepID=A0AAE0LE97_9CHLO|nr:hypothetical protein CYMTET_10338 [Cymbomonas tetramitiformis]
MTRGVLGNNGVLKVEFARSLVDFRLVGGIRGSLAAMLKGLHLVVPPTLLKEMSRMLTPEELSALISGLASIELDDWEEHTEYTHGLTRDSSEVRWFWQSVRLMEATNGQEQLQELLQFVTGARRVPVGGFAQLQGFNGGYHRFTLARGKHLHVDSLPTAHACICTLDLPPYTDLEMMQSKLHKALEMGTKRFDETAGQPQTKDEDQ